MSNGVGRRMGQITVICLLAVMSARSSALVDSRSISDNRLKPLVNSDENSKSPIKKAYTYVSEFKRLPVFNFGIGKRWIDNNGIKAAQPYSFGFGKRSTSENLYPLQMGVDYMPYDNYENYMSDDMQNDPRQQNKRSGRVRLYDFGVGKRMAIHSNAGIVGGNREANEALKKHPNDDIEQRFLYGLSNRFAEDPEDGLEEE